MADLQQRVNEFAVTRERRNSNVTSSTPPRCRSWLLARTFARTCGMRLGGVLPRLCVAFCLEYFDSHVKTPEQIKTELGLPFLGLVPLVNAREVVGSPLVQAIGLRARRASRPGSRGVQEAPDQRAPVNPTSARAVLITRRVWVRQDGRASNLATTLALSQSAVSSSTPT